MARSSSPPSSMRSSRSTCGGSPTCCGSAAASGAITRVRRHPSGPGDAAGARGDRHGDAGQLDRRPGARLLSAGRHRVRRLPARPRDGRLRTRAGRPARLPGGVHRRLPGARDLPGQRLVDDRGGAALGSAPPERPAVEGLVADPIDDARIAQPKRDAAARVRPARARPAGPRPDAADQHQQCPGLDLAAARPVRDVADRVQGPDRPAARRPARSRRQGRSPTFTFRGGSHRRPRRQRRAEVRHRQAASTARTGWPASATTSTTVWPRRPRRLSRRASWPRASLASLHRGL